MEQNEDIERFLEGKSSQEEIENLGEKAKKDEELAKLISSEIELKHSVAYANRMSLKRKLEKLDQTKVAKETKSFTFLKIAASIVLFLTAGLSVWYFTSGSKSDETFLAYYKPIKEMDLPSSRGSNDKELLESAYAAYLNGTYDKVVEYSSAVSSGPVSKSYANFILGLAQIEMKEFQAAVESFSTASETISPIEYDIIWYRALCYIQLGEYDQAIIDLNGLVDTKYSERANQVIDKVKN